MAYYDESVKPEFLSIDEAARELGVSRRTIERLLIREGIARFRRPGDRRHFVRRADVLRFRGFREIPSRYDPD